MRHTQADLERRLRLSRELLSAHEPPVLTKGLEGLQLSGPGRHLAIAFPGALGPVPVQRSVGDPRAALPKAEVVVITYTSDEGKALADVMTPGRFSSDWTPYARNYEAYLPSIRAGAPARQAGRLARYWQTQIGRKSVLVIKSELHMHEDFTFVNGRPTLPILDFFRQVVAEASPDYLFCIGTAGGLYTDAPLGSVAASRAVKFDCQKDFKNEPWASQQFQSDWPIPTGLHTQALTLMTPFLPDLAIAEGSPLAACPCKTLQSGSPPKATFLMDGHAGIPAFHPVLTTDFFEFGTDKNDLFKAGIAVEMDDAVFGLACTSVPSRLAPPMAKVPRWASIRNYSDPAINGSVSEADQESCATKIYLKYGYWTSVAGAIATWSVIADLP